MRLQHAIARRFAPPGAIELDYATSASNEPRYGHGKPPHPQLDALVGAGDYTAALDAMGRYQTDFAAIPRDETTPGEPWLKNYWFGGIDALSLYALIRDRKPPRYVEVGSGHSTMFARRAARDEGIDMRITSIDPNPRADIDRLCDQVIRQPLETADLTVFTDLPAGSVVFMDGSHRVFMNSDTVAFFLDVLPSLPSGLLVGVHDIYLPDDYTPDLAERYYSEQYMLGAYMLGGRVKVALPGWYVSTRPQFEEQRRRLWAGLDGLPLEGAIFWIES